MVHNTNRTWTRPSEYVHCTTNSCSNDEQYIFWYTCSCQSSTIYWNVSHTKNHMLHKNLVFHSPEHSIRYFRNQTTYQVNTSVSNFSSFTLSYWLHNRGPSPIHNASLRISLPVLVSREPKKYYLYPYNITVSMHGGYILTGVIVHVFFILDWSTWHNKLLERRSNRPR